MKNPTIKRGMVLCAGLGTRLLPITEKYPKPLVPVLNIPNLLHTFHLFRKAGVEDYVINLFHLPDAIEAFFKLPEYKNLSVSFSREKALLGTGGGLKKAEAFFKKEPFLLANCDFVTNINLSPIIEKHFKSGAMATMVLFKDEARQVHYSKVGVDKEGRLVSLPRLETQTPHRTGIFTGIHVLNPEALSLLEEKPCGINEVLYPHLMKEKPDAARAEILSDVYWFDTGDITQLWETTMGLMELMGKSGKKITDVLNAFHPVYREERPNIWVAEGTKLPSDTELVGPVIVGKDVDFARGLRIGPFAVVGDEAKIESGCTIEKSVVLSHAHIAKNTKCLGKIYFEKNALPTKALA